MSNKGFSYFELLLVLALLVIVSSVVQFSSSWLISKNNTGTIAKQICAHLGYVQQKAIEESRTWVMEFINNDNKDEYLIYPLDEPDSIRERVIISEKLVFWGDQNDAYLPAPKIEFNSSGAPLADSFIIGLRNEESDDLYIRITVVTGRTKIVSSIE